MVRSCIYDHRNHNSHRSYYRHNALRLRVLVLVFAAGRADLYVLRGQPILRVVRLSKCDT